MNMRAMRIHLPAAVRSPVMPMLRPTVLKAETVSKKRGVVISQMAAGGWGLKWGEWVENLGTYVQVPRWFPPSG